MGNEVRTDEQIRQMIKSDEFQNTLKGLFGEVQEKFAEYNIGVPPMDLFIDALIQISGTFRPSFASCPDAHEMYSDYLKFCAGNKIYELHPNLIHKLSATNIKSVPTEFLNLPYKSIMMKVPKGSLPFLTCGGDIRDTEEIIVSEIPANTHQDDNDHKALKILVRNSPYFAYFTISLSENEVHKCVDATIENIVSRFKNTDIDRSAPVIQDTSIPDSYKEEIVREIKQNSKFNEEKESQIRELFEFIMKTILYINGANADVYWYDENDYLRSKMKRARSPKKMRKIQSMMKRSGLYRVGYRITLSREERFMYEGAKTGNWKLTTRFMVQGHYRSQPYGEGRQQRKIIFIEPFYKGPEYAELINNPHIVK